MRPKRPTLVLGVEVHALQLYTHCYLCNDMVREGWEIAMCVELQRVNFDPKNQSWSFWSHNHETSMKMWKRALIFGRELALVT